MSRGAARHRLTSGWLAAAVAGALAATTAPASARDPAGERFTDIAGIRLDGTTLAAVRDRYGRAPLAHRGDAGGSTTSVCYRSLGGGTTTFLSGELGGRAHEVLGVAIAADGRGRGCAVPTRRAALLTRLPSGIAFGQPVGTFAAAIGAAPISRTSSTVRKVFSARLLHEGHVIDSTITVEGRFIHGRLSRFTVYRVLTN